MSPHDEQHEAQPASQGGGLPDGPPTETPRRARSKKKAKPKDPKHWANAKVDFAADARWVYSNIGRSDAKKRDAPNAGAWTWLQQCERNATFLQRFYTDTIKALMPSSRQLEQLERMSDDGGAVLELIEKALAGYKQQPTLRIPDVPVSSPPAQIPTNGGFVKQTYPGDPLGVPNSYDEGGPGQPDF